MTTTVVKIALQGHVDDLYALSLLFPEGAYPGLHVITQIVGTKVGLFDRVTNAEFRATFLTGATCLPIIGAAVPEAGWMASEILAPLNGYAAIADSNYKPVFPTSASWTTADGGGHATFTGPIRNEPKRLITAARHDADQGLMPSRITFMLENPLAAYAATTIADQPSWAIYYHLLEDIAGFRKTTLDKLDTAGLAKREALNAFKCAANNRTFGRHGSSKRDANLEQHELMSLREAREFVRSVVTAWLDLECGNHMPRDRVDGGPLRFGLE